MDNQRHHVVIVGAGFAGIHAAKALARYPEIQISIIDRRNYHLFQPLLYQVATAGLSPADIAMPIRSIFSKSPNVEVVLGNVTSVDLRGKTVQVDSESMSFDSLIVACGSKHSYFGRTEWEEQAPGLKTLEQATEIRRRILLSYERAEREGDRARQQEYLTFVIVGGGPTGVELAGAIAEISRFTLERDFRHIDATTARVILVEAGPRLLPGFLEALGRYAQRDLERLGVQVWTSTRVTDVLPEGVRVAKSASLPGREEMVRAQTVIWAAGVQPSSLSKALQVPLDRQGRVIVADDLTVPGFSYAYVLGDQAMFRGADGQPLPGMAPVAMQQGRWAARNIVRTLRGQPRQPFVYLDKGQMATIGRRKAVVQFRRFYFYGFLAWLTWLFVHIFYLIGFKNRVSVFLQWAWSYFTFKRGARLIVEKEWRSQVR